MLTLPLILTSYLGFTSGLVFPIRTGPLSLKSASPAQVGITYDVLVEVNGQEFWVLPDTGSSDLWITTADFQCISPLNNSELFQEDCRYGNTYVVPNTTEYAANQTFGVQYGTGIALGKVAYANVTIAGITIERQKVGLVDRTNDIGDGLQSGILGLGFPPLTSAHPGPTLDNETLLFNRAVYDPVFVSMYKQGLVDSWYSFAITRPSPNSNSTFSGWLGLGEYPPVAHMDDWAVTPIEVTKGLPDVLTGGQDAISLMTLTVDGIVMNTTSGAVPMPAGNSNTTSFQAVVDTGNPMNLFPPNIAQAVINGFSPAPTLDEASNLYIVECNAIAPQVGVVLDGHTFWLKSPEDLIFREEDGTCYSSITSTGEAGGISLNFLGGAFLRNVVSVFDFGKEEMRFATVAQNGEHGGPEFMGSAARSGSLEIWYAAMLSVVAVWWA